VLQAGAFLISLLSFFSLPLRIGGSAVRRKSGSIAIDKRLRVFVIGQTGVDLAFYTHATRL
jgi:hypothetical protein